jgi:hypothetical protein
MQTAAFVAVYQQTGRSGGKKGREEKEEDSQEQQ